MLNSNLPLVPNKNQPNSSCKLPQKKEALKNQSDSSAESPSKAGMIKQFKILQQNKKLIEANKSLTRENLQLKQRVEILEDIILGQNREKPFSPYADLSPLYDVSSSEQDTYSSESMNENQRFQTGNGSSAEVKTLGKEKLPNFFKSPPKYDSFKPTPGPIKSVQESEKTATTKIDSLHN